MKIFSFLRPKDKKTAAEPSAPNYMTTSNFIGSVDHSWFGRDMGSTREMFHMVACCRSRKNTENGLWDIRVQLNDDDANQPVRTAMTYTQAIDYMMGIEMQVARKNGEQGSREEIADKRRPLVEKNNVLNYWPLKTPTV